MIHAFAEAPDCANIFQEKWDIKDGFWRLDCKEGEEWNFCYVLPHKPGMPINTMVQTSLQMGCIETPTYFCAVSEMVRDVTEQYNDTPVGSLALHKFVNLTEVNPDFSEPPKKDISNEPSNYMLEVYMDYYIALAIPSIQDQLNHVTNTIMTGIHDVFPPDKDDKEDAISLKKTLKQEAACAIIKNVLGFKFDVNPDEHTIWLIEDHRTDILKRSKKWIREGEHRKKGILFEEFRTYLAKLRYSLIIIPAGKGLLSLCNQMLGKEPKNIFLHKNKPLLSAIRDCCHLLEL